MTNDKNILIKNIYYMLAYAFQVLKRNNYASIASEKFEHIEDLFAEILSRGISYQSLIPQHYNLTLFISS